MIILDNCKSCSPSPSQAVRFHPALFHQHKAPSAHTIDGVPERGVIGYSYLSDLCGYTIDCPAHNSDKAAERVDVRGRCLCVILASTIVSRFKNIMYARGETQAFTRSITSLSLSLSLSLAAVFPPLSINQFTLLQTQNAQEKQTEEKAKKESYLPSCSFHFGSGP